MAKREKKEVGKSIWENALAKLPKEKQELLKGLTEEDLGGVQEVLGEHGLLRDDYSRLADEAKAQNDRSIAMYNDNLKWREDNAVAFSRGTEALTTLERMKAAGVDLSVVGDGDGGESKKRTIPPDVISKEDFAKAIRQTEVQGLTLMTTLSTLQGKHMKEFGGEPLDTGEVVALAQKSGTDINTAYNNFVAEKREAVRKAELDRAIAKAKKDGYDEGISKATKLPYPGPTGDEGPTTLSGLTKDQEKLKSFGVDAAVREFNQNRLAKQ